MNDEFDISTYWENRYKAGKTSGGGSYGRLAEFKAAVLNDFVERQDVKTVVEFGCGDGNQLSLARYPVYTGYDVSETAVQLCKAKFANDPSKQFRHVRDYAGEDAELALSLDVIFHLVEDNAFEDYMRRLFNAARRFVIIYSSNTHDLHDKNPHVLHRCFTAWTQHRRDFKLVSTIANPYSLALRATEGGPSSDYSPSDFYVFERIS